MIAKTPHQSASRCLLLCSMLSLGYLPLCITLLLGILVSYMLLSIGFVDDVLIARSRPRMLKGIEVASNREPPDIDSLANALRGSDWLVAAAAAERIGILWQSGELEPEQADITVRSLLDTLASTGHWWRFSWDQEEPEFQQFRGAAIEATAKFGATTLPLLSRAMDSDSPFEREASCWIVLSMVKGSSVDRATLLKAGIPDRIRGLTANDSEAGVRESCSFAIRAIESEVTTDRAPTLSETGDSE